METYQWKAILSCDARWDGLFYYGVVTTSIVCKPSCKSRPPRREHVRIFESIPSAITAGFRPCKRCQPDRPDWECAKALTSAVNRLIATRYGEPLSLRKMAREVRVNPYHLHRTYKQQTGITPIQALQRQRLAVARKCLRTNDKPITQIAQETGFSTPSHFSAVFRRHFGQTPTAFRSQPDNGQQEEMA